ILKKILISSVFRRFLPFFLYCFIVEHLCTLQLLQHMLSLPFPQSLSMTSRWINKLLCLQLPMCNLSVWCLHKRKRDQTYQASCQHGRYHHCSIRSLY
ncbi:hypothetical protein GCK32_004688, partial [Trichostrongylus colubriformis]